MSPHLNLAAVKDVLTIVALLLGSGWAVYKFYIMRPLEWRIDLSGAFDSAQYNLDDRFCVVVLRITLHNIGPVPIIPGDRGLEVSIREIPATRQKKEIINWDDCIRVVEDFDVLVRYKFTASKSYKGIYCIDPNVSFPEPVPIRLERNKMYACKINLWQWKNRDNVVNYAYTQCA
jgi:hypothetical protein